MPIEKIIAPEAYKSRACHALRIGDWVYTTGLDGVRPDGTLPDSFEEQAHQTFKNIEKVLAAAGAKMSDICISWNYFDKPESMAKFFEIRAQYMKDPPGEVPHRVGHMGTTQWANPKMKIEVMVSAYTGK